jgi:hypothetical protein
MNDRTERLGRKQAVELAAALLGLLALVLYAIGWSFLDRFYAKFGVEPEEAGKSWTWTIARAAVVVIPPLALIATGGAIVGSGSRGVAWVESRTSRADRWLTWLAAAVVLVAAGLTALVVVLGIGTSAAGWAVALLLTLGLIGVGYAAASSRWALLVLAGAATIAGLLQTSRAMADGFAAAVVRDGKFSFQPFDIGPVAFDIPEVRVYVPNHPLHNSCVALLGVGPEVVILYVDVPDDNIHNYTNEVWRLPAGDVQLAYFHPSGLCQRPVGYVFDQHWPQDRPNTSQG